MPDPANSPATNPAEPPATSPAASPESPPSVGESSAMPPDAAAPAESQVPLSPPDDAPPQIVESAAPSQPPARNPQLDAIIAKVQAAFEDCEDKQRQAIDLRRESRRLRAVLDTLGDAGERAHAADHADALLRQACAIEERLPNLMSGVGELMVAQIKEISERPE